MNALDITYLCVNAGVAVYLWRRVGLRFSCSMLVLSAFLVIYGPAHVSFQLDRETNTALHSTITLALLVMWVCLLLGMELPRWIWRREFAHMRRVSASWKALPLRAGFAPGSLFGPVALIILAVLAADFVVEGQLAKVVSYYGSVGLLEEQLLLRQDEGGSRFYLVNIVVLTIAPFITMVLLCEAVRLGTTRARVVFWIAFAVVLLAKLATLQKSPAAIYLLQLGLAYWLIRSNRLRPRALLAAASIFLLAMVPLSLAAFPGIELSDLLGYFSRRVVEAPQETLEYYFTVYPDQIAFLQGLGFRWLHAVIGTGDYVGSSLVVANLQDSEGSSFNALFIADSWADFGYLGVALASVGLGIAARLADMYAFSLGKSSASIAVIASMLFAVIYVASASFSAALITGGLALIPLVAWLLRHPIAPRSAAPSALVAPTR